MKFIKVKMDNITFELAETPVTQGQWFELMGNNPSNFKGINNPVEQVSWNDCQEFINKLNQLNDGYWYRLPFEKEWEFCATSCDEQNINEIAWNKDNSDSKTHEVGKLKPNSLGFYDMLGNVWELCEDKWSTQEGSSRVIRGGSWYFHARYLRSAVRYFNSPGYRSNYVGFRPLRTKNSKELFNKLLDKELE